MKRLPYILLLLFLSAGIPIFSQTISSQKGLTTVIFKMAEGTVQVYLPADMRSGDIISGSVLASPAGNNAKQVQKSLKQLGKVKISIGSASNAVTQPLQHAAADIPAALEKITAAFPFIIFVTDAAGNVSTAEIKPAAVSNAQTGCSIPSHIQAAAPMRITGNFDGDASNTKCMIDDKEMPVLAESPRQCICSVPENAPGKGNVTITEPQQQKCSAPVTVVHMQLTAGKLDLLKGEKTTIDVNISGLAGIEQPATLSVTNRTAATVTMINGNGQEFILAPGEYKDSTVFTKQFVVQSIKSGRFAVDFNLALPENNPPVFADIKDAKGGKRDEGVLSAGIKTALEIGMKKWNDANTEGRNPVDWDCPSCFQCIQSITFAANAGQVGTLGWGIITSFLSGGIKLAGGLLNKVKDIADKGGDIYKAIQDLIDAGEIQVIGFKEQWCPGNSYCKVTGIIVYDVKTGCVEAEYKCTGTKMCCPFTETNYVLKYCLDKDGAVIADTVSMSISH